MPRGAERLETYSGKVILAPVSPGSKSERLAVQLDTGSEKLLLRRPGIKRYRDEALEELVGRQVSCLALKRGARLYIRKWSIVDKA